MTVKELREQLSTMPDDAPVSIETTSRRFTATGASCMNESIDGKRQPVVTIWAESK